MPLLTLNNVSCAYGTHIVLDEVTMAIEVGEKIGLIGRNGSGKTTLMRMMLGTQQPDSGTRQLSRGSRVGYLRQDPDFEPDESVRDAAEGAFAELHRLHQEIDHVYEKMATAAGTQLDQLMTRQSSLETRMQAAGGYAVSHRIEASLHGLGFADEQFALPTKVLSGGQLSRLGLARLLLEEPDLLLLDEPTNHLDIAGRQWLERFLADEYQGVVVIVSHDRWLLDRVVKRVVEVEDASLYEYPGNYTKYVELRQHRKLTEHRTYGKQLDRVRQEEGYIARYKAGQRARQARGRESRLERFKQTEMLGRPRELDVMKLNLPKPARSGEQVLGAEQVSKRYGDLVLFEDLSIEVQRGQRIGIIGPNGTGKTTLVACLLGDLEPDTGRVRIGSRLSIGYYRQIPRDIDGSLTVWQYLQQKIVSLDGQAKASEQQARDLAGAFLFSGIEQDKQLADLSGGERSRAVLAGLVSAAHNLLVLDEPTNHLDIPSAERIERTLSHKAGWDGTLLLVSHDRALLDATCDELLVFDGSGGVKHFRGRYSEWAEKVQAEQQARRSPGPRSREKTPPAPTPKTRGGKKPKVSLSQLESRIERVESRMKAIDILMMDPAVYTDGARCRDLKTERAKLQSELGPLENEWARRAEA